MILGKKLERRTFLRGMGAAVALPFLDAMVPALAAPAANASPLRMAFCYVPNGIIMEHWLPAIPEGAADTPLPTKFPRIITTLEPYREDILMFGGMTCNGARALGDGPGDHGRAGANYLTATHIRKKLRARICGPAFPRTRSLLLMLEEKHDLPRWRWGCEEGLQGGSCDSGYSCAYSNDLSWRTPGSPLAPEVRPRALFDRLFGAGDFERDPVRRARKAAVRGSILDMVLSSASNLRASVGPADQRKLDEYLFAVRDIEKRIQKIEEAGSEQAPPPFDRPASSVPDSFAEHSQLMFDMMTVAFQTNATRVITMVMAVEYSSRTYREIGIAEGHHGLTHHMGDPEKIEKVARINEFHAKQFAYFLNKLKSTQDGEGSLLDHSMIVYGSALADGNHHQHDHVPTMLVGKANGTVKPGRFLTYPDETPLGNLWTSMLARMGVTEKVGDSTGPFTNLS